MKAAYLSKELLDRAVAATVAAIEIYSKLGFLYREEAFAVLQQLGIAPQGELGEVANGRSVELQFAEVGLCGMTGIGKAERLQWAQTGRLLTVLRHSASGV